MTSLGGSPILTGCEMLMEIHWATVVSHHRYKCQINKIVSTLLLRHIPT